MAMAYRALEFTKFIATMKNFLQAINANKSSSCNGSQQHVNRNNYLLHLLTHLLVL